jgi:hypothetical protein
LIEMDRLKPALKLEGVHTATHTAWSQSVPPMSKLRGRFSPVSGNLFCRSTKLLPLRCVAREKIAIGRAFLLVNARRNDAIG